ncbi:protein FAM209-like [Odocoileus virginianus]|uniref:Protein FAM209-like n=1 Tax=Odocoileus virginianus TaxID=9874 RepID=A0ABM4IR97_ODOVR
MARRVLARAGPSVTSPRAPPCLVLSLQMPGQTSAPGATSPLTMRSVMWFFFWSMCVSSFCAFVFFCLRDDTIELPGMVPCGRHFRIQQNLPEHDRGWLGSKLHWFFLLVVLFVIQKFPGDSDESTVQTPPALRGGSLGSSGKKEKKASPNKDYMFDTLIQLEMDLVKFVSRVQNLKLAMATGSNLSLPSFEVPADIHNNITIHELCGDEDFNEDSE